jgi:hypothetical protein
LTADWHPQRAGLTNPAPRFSALLGCCTFFAGCRFWRSESVESGQGKPVEGKQARLHYQPALPQTRPVLRKDCSKFWPIRYALQQAAILQNSVIDSFGGGTREWNQEVAAFMSPVLPTSYSVSEIMVMPTETSGKVLQFVTPQTSIEGELEKWFRGVMVSHHDLMFALEQLRDAFKKLLAEQALDEADYAVLAVAEVTLNNARNARAL